MLRGLTTGTVAVTSTWWEPVILWGNTFCSWVGAAQELQLRPVAVILSSLELVKLVQATVDSDCFEQEAKYVGCVCEQSNASTREPMYFLTRDQLCIQSEEGGAVGRV
jgi:hypothetical protein